LIDSLYIFGFAERKPDQTRNSVKQTEQRNAFPAQNPDVEADVAQAEY